MVAVQGMSILSNLPQEKDHVASWPAHIEQIDSSKPLTFLDGASQGDDQRCGGGGDSISFRISLFPNKNGIGSWHKQLY